MIFRSKDGPIPDDHFGNEVPVKKDPYDCYSPGMKERDARWAAEVKVGRRAAMAERANTKPQ